jgi:hypothetical protein
VEVQELAPGLWRWTATHPEWEPGQGWEPAVACFYVEADDATLLVDPLVPRGKDEVRFWEHLDADVAQRGQPVAVLLTSPSHRRSSGEVAERFSASVHENPSPSDALPGGARVVEPWEEGISPFWLPSHRALAVGDGLTTVDGVLRVWWSHPELSRWLELPIDHVLVAHGDHVAGGRRALAAALELAPFS